MLSVLAMIADSFRTWLVSSPARLQLKRTFSLLKSITVGDFVIGKVEDVGGTLAKPMVWFKVGSLITSLGCLLSSHSLSR